jgi:hypothetical protein
MELVLEAISINYLENAYSHTSLFSNNTEMKNNVLKSIEIPGM